jgi:hypothetical protein
VGRGLRPKVESGKLKEKEGFNAEGTENTEFAEKREAANGEVQEPLKKKTKE